MNILFKRLDELKRKEKALETLLAYCDLEFDIAQAKIEQEGFSAELSFRCDVLREIENFINDQLKKETSHA